MISYRTDRLWKTHLLTFHVIAFLSLYMYILRSHPANEDYVGHSMAVPVTFQTSALQSPEMQGRACASLVVIDDDNVEGNETLRVQIEPDYDDTSVKIADQSSAIVTIVDDDFGRLLPTLYKL